MLLRKKQTACTRAIITFKSVYTFSSYLCKVPKPLGNPRHSITFFQTGSTSSAIINEAFCIRQEGGGPQGTKLEKPLRRVPSQLQAEGNQICYTT